MKPLCRCCGRPIPKFTLLTWIAELGSEHGPKDALRIDPKQWPTSKADCQRLTNGIVTKVNNGMTRIDGFYAWDGKTYRGTGQGGEFFCTGQCALDFGKIMAKAGHCTVRYNSQLKMQLLKERQKPGSDEPGAGASTAGT